MFGKGKIVFIGLMSILISVFMHGSDYDNSLRQGLKSSEERQYEQAAAHFTKAIQVKPEQAQPLLERSYAYFKLKKYSLALDDLARAAKLAPNEARIYYYNGIIYAQLKKLPQAVKNLNKAMRLDQFNKSYNLKRGQIYLEMKAYPEAAADFTEVIDSGYMTGYAYYLRGRSYQKMDQQKLAGQDFTEAIKLKTKNPAVYYHRSQVLLKQKKIQASLEDINHAIQLNPQWADAYLMKARLYSKTNQPQPALKEIEKAIQLNSDWSYPYYERGKIYAGLEKYALALADFSRAHQLTPQWQKPLFERARVYGKLNQIDQALEDLSFLIDQKPTARNLTERGKLLVQTNQNQKARADFTRAIELSPQYSYAYYYRARLAYKTRHAYDQALEDLSAAIKIEAKWLDLYYERGCVYLLKNDLKKARADFQYYLKENQTTNLYANFLYLIASYPLSKFNLKQALTALNQKAEQKNKNTWPYPIAFYFLDQLNPSDLIALGDNNEKKCEVHCYLGYQYLIKQDENNAKKHFQQAVNTRVTLFIEYQLAKMQLARLNESPQKN